MPKKQPPLSLTDQRHLDAAMGWFALRDNSSALEELRCISLEGQRHSAFLAFWFAFAIFGAPDIPSAFPAPNS
jgi:hypothetical protein